jgi:pyrrolidone-carboxylate peptidase
MSNRPAWLVSAFEPFLNREFNQSMRVLDELIQIHRTSSAPFDLHTLVLPTEYDRCALVLLAEIERLKTKGVTLTGVLSMGEGREDFKIETQANNMDHAPNLADNSGSIRNQQRIFPIEADTLPLDFPYEKFEIDLSMSPGFYVCNHLCARMAMATRKDPTLPMFGFIHVPRLEFNPHFTTKGCAQTIYQGLQRIV